jgi:putative membrane protein
LWGLLALYGLMRVAQVLPLGIPLLAIEALHIFLPLGFALVHGARLYGRRGMGVFCALGLLVGNGLENLGVLTGFPFGHYYFTDGMGPKVFAVPILLGLAYLGMGYLSWTLGRLLVGATGRGLRGEQVVVLPLVGALVMVAWDFAMDPSWATVLRLWVWRDGGGYFGVPLTNFIGWYLTVYVFFQVFALFVRDGTGVGGRELSGGYGRVAVYFYGACALGNALLMLAPEGRAGLPALVADPAGVVWRVGDIAATCALVSLITMGGFAGMALVRTFERSEAEAL